MRVFDLCFHGIGEPNRSLEPGEAHYWIAADFFCRVLDQLTDRLDVQLSFDDGNSSDILIGLPALLDRGMHAQFFALAGRLGERGSLTADDLKELRARGMRIGSHGMRHIPWRGMSAADAQTEWVEARQLLAEASAGCVEDAACPLGRYDRTVLSSLRKLGYGALYSSDRVPIRSTRWPLPRYSVTAADTLESVMAFLAGPPLLSSVSMRAKRAVKALR